MADVKDGAETSEKKVADSASIWGSIATVIGFIISIGSTLTPALGDGSRIGMIVGAIIAIAGILQKTFVSLGYIKSRAEVKVAASLER